MMSAMIAGRKIDAPMNTNLSTRNPIAPPPANPMRIPKNRPDHLMLGSPLMPSF